MIKFNGKYYPKEALQAIKQFMEAVRDGQNGKIKRIAGVWLFLPSIK